MYLIVRQIIKIKKNIISLRHAFITRQLKKNINQNIIDVCVCVYLCIVNKFYLHISFA